MRGEEEGEISRGERGGVRREGRGEEEEEEQEGKGEEERKRRRNANRQIRNLNSATRRMCKLISSKITRGTIAVINVCG